MACLASNFINSQEPGRRGREHSPEASFCVLRLLDRLGPAILLHGICKDGSVWRIQTAQELSWRSSAIVGHHKNLEILSIYDLQDYYFERFARYHLVRASTCARNIRHPDQMDMSFAMCSSTPRDDLSILGTRLPLSQQGMVRRPHPPPGHRTIPSLAFLASCQIQADNKIIGLSQGEHLIGQSR